MFVRMIASNVRTVDAVGRLVAGRGPEVCDADHRTEGTAPITDASPAQAFDLVRTAERDRKQWLRFASYLFMGASMIAKALATRAMRGMGHASAR
jgi:hypothetical protein